MSFTTTTWRCSGGAPRAAAADVAAAGLPASGFSRDEFRAAMRASDLKTHPDKRGGKKEEFQESHATFERVGDACTRPDGFGPAGSPLLNLAFTTEYLGGEDSFWCSAVAPGVVEVYFGQGTPLTLTDMTPFDRLFIELTNDQPAKCGPPPPSSADVRALRGAVEKAQLNDEQVDGVMREFMLEFERSEGVRAKKLWGVRAGVAGCVLAAGLVGGCLAISTVKNMKDLVMGREAEIRAGISSARTEAAAIFSHTDRPICIDPSMWSNGRTSAEQIIADTWHQVTNPFLDTKTQNLFAETTHAAETLPSTDAYKHAEGSTFCDKAKFLHEMNETATDTLSKSIIASLPMLESDQLWSPAMTQATTLIALSIGSAAVAVSRAQGRRAAAGAKVQAEKYAADARGRRDYHNKMLPSHVAVDTKQLLMKAIDVVSSRPEAFDAIRAAIFSAIDASSEGLIVGDSI